MLGGLVILLDVCQTLCYLLKLNKVFFLIQQYHKLIHSYITFIQYYVLCIYSAVSFFLIQLLPLGFTTADHLPPYL